MIRTKYPTFRKAEDKTRFRLHDPSYTSRTDLPLSLVYVGYSGTDLTLFF
jgi:hypothetical protein